MQLKDPDGTIQQLLETFSTKAAIQTLSFDLKMTYYLLWSNYYLTIKNDITNALVHLKYILCLFDDYPQFISEHTNRYISVVNKLLAKSLLKIIQRAKKEQAELWQRLRLDLKAADTQKNGMKELRYCLEDKQ